MNDDFYIKVNLLGGKNSLIAGREKISLLTEDEIKELPEHRFLAYRLKFNDRVRGKVEKAGFDYLEASFIKAYDYLRHAVKREGLRRSI